MLSLSLRALLSLTLCVAAAQSAAAVESGIQMLPPVQSSDTSNACLSSEGNKLLSWDGKTAIQCNKNTTISSAGELGVGTSDPKAKLDVRGKAMISGDTGIGTTAPAATLDINGGMKITDGGESCSAATGGMMRYNSATKMMDYCNETGWIPMDRGVYNCVAIHQTSSSADTTFTCPDNKKVLNGACWLVTGRYVGTKSVISPNLNQFICNIKGTTGLHVYVTCCDGISAP